MNKKLFLQAITKFTFGVLIISMLLFIPANTINYWNGWLFMALLFIPMFIAGVVMLIKSPELLAKRLNAKEKENEQKQVIAVSGIMFILGFIIAGLNYRYNWIEIPNFVVIISSIIFILSYILIFIYNKYKTLLAPIILHIGVNTTVVLIINIIVVNVNNLNSLLFLMGIIFVLISSVKIFKNT